MESYLTNSENFWPFGFFEGQKAKKGQKTKCCQMTYNCPIRREIQQNFFSWNKMFWPSRQYHMALRSETFGLFYNGNPFLHIKEACIKKSAIKKQKNFWKLYSPQAHSCRSMAGSNPIPVLPIIMWAGGGAGRILLRYSWVHLELETSPN